MIQAWQFLVARNANTAAEIIELEVVRAPSKKEDPEPVEQASPSNAGFVVPGVPSLNQECSKGPESEVAKNILTIPVNEGTRTSFVSGSIISAPVIGDPDQDILQTAVN